MECTSRTATDRCVNERKLRAALLLSRSVLVRVNKVLKSGKRYSNITLLDRCIGFLIQSVAHITISMK